MELTIQLEHLKFVIGFAVVAWTISRTYFFRKGVRKEFERMERSHKMDICSHTLLHRIQKLEKQNETGLKDQGPMPGKVENGYVATGDIRYSPYRKATITNIGCHRRFMFKNANLKGRLEQLGWEEYYLIKNSSLSQWEKVSKGKHSKHGLSGIVLGQFVVYPGDDSCIRTELFRIESARGYAYIMIDAEGLQFDD